MIHVYVLVHSGFVMRCIVIEQLITNPECTKTYSDDNFRIIGQARWFVLLSVWNQFT